MERTHGDELLTIKEAAALLKMSTVTVRRWLKQGRLTGYRAGPRSIRLRRRDVEALLEPAENGVTDETLARRREAAERMRELRAEMARRHGGKPMASSVDLIREDRERDSCPRDLPPLTDEEVAQQLKILERAKTLRVEMRRKRGGKCMPSSAALIRAEREKRSFGA